MGVTIIVGICVFIAGSLIEYKIVKAVPGLEPFFRGIPGIIISLAIGWAVGFAIGGATGAGFALGQTVGVATNRWTYDFYSGLERVNNRRRKAMGQVRSFQAEHPALFTEAKMTVVGGVKTVIGIILAILYVIGLPYRLFTLVRSWIHKLRGQFQKEDVSARA